MSFTLHPQLAADTFEVGQLACCRLLLMNDRRFPWLILVPAREGLCELFDLSGTDYTQTMAEVRDVSERLRAHAKAEKINVAALGNRVPQLHIHIIARYTTDAAWPNPVWSASGSAEPYEKEEGDSVVRALAAAIFQGAENITKM
jgi:diadenosine tetraphosphate (Ap4A) HIT family hydrolase